MPVSVDCGILSEEADVDEDERLDHGRDEPYADGFDVEEAVIQA